MRQGSKESINTFSYMNFQNFETVMNTLLYGTLRNLNLKFDRLDDLINLIHIEINL